MAVVNPNLINLTQKDDKASKLKPTGQTFMKKVFKHIKV